MGRVGKSLGSAGGATKTLPLIMSCIGYIACRSGTCGRQLSVQFMECISVGQGLIQDPLLDETHYNLCTKYGLSAHAGDQNVRLVW